MNGICPEFLLKCREQLSELDSSVKNYNIELGVSYGTSMCPTFGKKTLQILNKTFDPESIKIGEVIQVKADLPISGRSLPIHPKSIGHRLITIHPNFTVYATRGDNTGNQIELTFLNEFVEGIIKPLYIFESCERTNICDSTKPPKIYCIGVDSCPEEFIKWVESLDYCVY